MKRTAGLILLAALLASPLFAAGYVGLTVSPYVDTGSVAWSISPSNGLNFPTYDIYNMGLEPGIEVGFIGEGSVYFGTVLALGLAFPLDQETEDPDGIPLYSIALNPAIIFTLGMNFTERFSGEFGLGFGMFFSFLNDKVNGQKVTGSATHYLEYMASLAFQYSFTEHWGIKGGLRVKVNSFIMPEIYRFEAKGADYRKTSALSTIFHWQPFIGAVYLW